MRVSCFTPMCLHACCWHVFCGKPQCSLPELPRLCNNLVWLSHSPHSPPPLLALLHLPSSSQSRLICRRCGDANICAASSVARDIVCSRLTSPLRTNKGRMQMRLFGYMATGCRTHDTCNTPGHTATQYCRVAKLGPGISV